MGPLLPCLHVPDSCLLPAPCSLQGNSQSHSLRQRVHALPQACSDGITERYSSACLHAGLQHLQEFVQWVTRYLVGCLYPEAPSSRKYLAMQLLNTVLDVWQTPNGSTKFYQRPDDTVLEGDGALRIGQHSFAPFYPGFFGPDLMQKLLGEARSRFRTSHSRGLQSSVRGIVDLKRHWHCWGSSRGVCPSAQALSVLRRHKSRCVRRVWQGEMCPTCESGGLLLQAVGAGALRQVPPFLACIVQPSRLLEPGLHVHLGIQAASALLSQHGSS